MSMTMDALRDLIKQHDYPGRMVLSRADFESVIDNLPDRTRYPLERGDSGSRQFWFGETCVACEPPNDRVVDLTDGVEIGPWKEKPCGGAYTDHPETIGGPPVMAFERDIKPLNSLPGSIEIPCHTPEAEWVESPLVTPPAPEVRKGAKRKKAHDASEVVSD